MNGVWEVKINWQWQNKTGTVDAEAHVTQTMFKLSIDMQSARTRSHTASVVMNKPSFSSAPTLYYLYDAEPTAGYEDDNPAHHGAAILRFDIGNENKLQGNYFTDRSSRGHFVMRRP